MHLFFFLPFCQHLDNQEAAHSAVSELWLKYSHPPRYLICAEDDARITTYYLSGVDMIYGIYVIIELYL